MPNEAKESEPLQDKAEVRLELLIGHLADLLTPARQLVGELKARANASTVTRGHLDRLGSMTAVIWEQLGSIAEEAKVIRLRLEGCQMVEAGRAGRWPGRDVPVEAEGLPRSAGDS
jgi:hypothetical protein